MCPRSFPVTPDLRRFLPTKAVVQSCGLFVFSHFIFSAGSVQHPALLTATAAIPNSPVLLINGTVLQFSAYAIEVPACPLLFLMSQPI